MLNWVTLAQGSLASSAVHLLAYLAAAFVIIQLIRLISERSRLLGSIVLAGLALRAVGGVALYWISLRHLPFMRSLQLGDGFWLLALDGRSYFDLASHAAVHGLGAISPSSASPAYTRLLAVSLRVFGQSPLTSVLVNSIAYVASCALCTAMWPADEGPTRAGRAVAVAALSFSPSLVIFATQPLKDQVFVLLIVAIVCCLKPVLSLGAAKANRWGLAALLLIAAGGAMYVIGGIRAYYGVLIVLSVLATMAIYACALPLRRWPLQAGAATATGLVLWIAFVDGAGPYATRYRRIAGNSLRLSTADSKFTAAAAPIDEAREAFLNAGGATNLVFRTARTPASPSDRIENEAIGVLALTVPITLIKRLPGMAFSGGRGLLAVTDIDTVFLDATILLELVILVRSWKVRRGDVAYLTFLLMIGVAVMLLLAYVVTNYGTLFRLRLMYAVPLWLSGAAMGSSMERAERRRRIPQTVRS